MLFCIFFLLTALFFPKGAEGRLLNLGGSLDLSYGRLRTTQQDAVTETTFLQQRYSLHNFGDILDPRIGTFSLNGTFMTQSSESKGGFIGQNLTDQDFKLSDYSLAVNLFPYISPFNFYAQRVTRSNQTDVIVKDRITTYGANWSLSVPRLPRLALSYNQSELRSENRDRFPDTLSRFFNAESSGRLGATTLIGRYQFNQTDIFRPTGGDVGTVRGSSVNLTTQTRVTPALSLSANARYTDTAGVNAPGLTLAQERGIGASLFYAPSVYWDTHARVDYSEMPDNINFKRFNAFWGGSIRPTELVDIVGSLRLFRFDVNGTTTTSPFGDLNVSYRPFFGLSTGLGGSWGNTRTEGEGNDLNSLYQRYRGHVNYTRSSEMLRYTAGYSVSYGTADTSRSSGLIPPVQPGQPSQPDQDRIKDLMNTLSLGVENTRIRFVHVALSLAFNDINRDQSSGMIQPVANQRSYVYLINVDSSYFRSLLFRDDSLFLQASSSLTRINGFGPAGSTFVFDVRGNYHFLGGGSLSTGWTRQDYPSGFYFDSNIYFEEIQWNFYVGRTNVTLRARGNQQRGEGNASLDRETLEFTTVLAYQIGKFLLNLDHRWANDRTAGVKYRNETIFARASRVF